MATAINEQTLNNFIETAKSAGCPRAQLDGFILAGYVPQPRQLEFHAAAREADNPDGPDSIALGGARGPGKSHAVLAQAGIDDCQRVPGLKVLFLRNVGKSAKESFEDLILRVLYGVHYTYIPTRSRLEFPNGSRIILGGFKNDSDIDQYLGIEYDLIIVEEATLLSKRKIDMLGGSLRTSKTNWRPRMYLSTNPGGVGHAWFKATFVKPWREKREIFTRFIFGTYRDNKFLNPEYVRYLEGLVGWLGKAWRDGDWDIAAGQFFTNWRHDVHVIKPFDIPEGWRVWGCLDYGFTHFTAVYILTESDDGDVYAIAEHAERRWLPSQHAAAIKAMVGRIYREASGKRRPMEMHELYTFVAGADVFAKRESGTTIADQYEDLGVTLSRAKMDRVNGWAKVLELLGDVDARPPIKPRLFVFNRCARLIECIPSLEHDPNRPEDVVKVDVDEDGNGGDDPADSLRYGVMELPSKVQVIEDPFAGW